MASSTPYSLFPNATGSVAKPQPRKSSLKKAKPSEISVASPELKGVAFEVKSAPILVQPANEHIRHTLSPAQSPDSQSTSNRGTLRRQLRARRRFSASSSVYSTDSVPGDSALLEEDELPPLPENTHFGPGKPTTDHLRRPSVPRTVSTDVQPDNDTLVSPGGDGLSPLPSQLCFPATSPSSSEFPGSQHPAPRTLRAGSPVLRRRNSAESPCPPYSPGSSVPATSIFPQYDPTKPLQQQDYYPAGRARTPSLPSEKISKINSSPIDKHIAQRSDSAVALMNEYEHIPAAEYSDLLAIRNASCGEVPAQSRKVQLRLLQPRSRGTTLAMGVSENELLYSMGKDCVAASAKEARPAKQLLINKHIPRQPSFETVAQLALPDSTKSDKNRDNNVVSIFPQTAAIRAIETVANSPVASHIASFDPKAESPQAAQLAQDAVAEARKRYGCELVRATRKRDSLGAVTAMYRLEHPTLGTFPITITKSTVGRHSRDPRAKISVHHASATPAAVAAETLVLAFLDFARDACILDTPAILALEGSYIIDTIICALLAVAVVENDALMAETITFDAPPKSPLPLRKRDSRGSTSGESKKSKRSSWYKREKKVKNDFDGEQVELPVLTQGALAIIGLSFKTAVWVLEAGVKMTAGVVVGLTHLASKA